MVSLPAKTGGKRKDYTVHSIVALAFIGPRPKGQVVRHGPAGRLVNTDANISYGTRAENDEDVRTHGMQHGANNGNAKLSWDAVAAIRLLLAGGVEGTAIARKFGVSATTVCDIKKGRNWVSR
jgi:hypothetical protein